jgi:hypothetical protein
MLALATMDVQGQSIAGNVTNTWPFGAIEDVVKDGNDVFAASGGGVLVLNTSASNPQLESGNSQLRSGGLSTQLAVT